MITTGRLLLAIGGALSAAIAAIHLVVIAIGPAAYRYFGSGDRLARSAEAGSLAPAMVTLVIGLLFGLCALYGFSGAGVVRRLPLLRPALMLISIVYLVRGLPAFPQSVAFVMAPSTMPFRYFAFSLMSLIAGFSYAMGTRAAWDWLERERQG